LPTATPPTKRDLTHLFRKIKGVDHVLVHADGPPCQGTALDLDGTCPACGIHPDMQSTEFWLPDLAK